MIYLLPAYPEAKRIPGTVQVLDDHGTVVEDSEALIATRGYVELMAWFAMMMGQ